MNTITKDDVAHIAHLARIHLTAKEVDHFTKDLSSIIDYVQQLRAVDTRGVPPTTHAKGKELLSRDDVAVSSSQEVRDALLSAVPLREKEHIKVKAVW